MPVQLYRGAAESLILILFLVSTFPLPLTTTVLYYHPLIVDYHKICFVKEHSSKSISWKIRTYVINDILVRLKRFYSCLNDVFIKKDAHCIIEYLLVVNIYVTA